MTPLPLRICPSCCVANINGIRCHELHCPDAWRDEIRECKECGCEFQPEGRHQRYCSNQCVGYSLGISMDID